MIAFNDTDPSAAHPAFPGSRSDFLRALESLGAMLEATTCPEAAVRVRFQCVLDDWVRFFGEIRVIGENVSLGGGATDFQAWSCQCADGPVLCIGFRYRGRSGRDYVVVRSLQAC